MKKLFIFLFLCLLLVSNSYAGISNLPAASDPVAANVSAEAKLGIDDLRNLSVKEIEAKIGHDLTWKQKLAIKVLKSKATKAEKHPEKPAASTNNIIGFLLGLVLSIIGVLITYVAFQGERSTIKAAWIGFAVGLLLYILVLV
ncbi:hypothetical protein [Haliscomenobacter sp.]|uniref:hypothetical protein n=1 Tax=Haliscomenobacter sp. TaxID=2717303 RepID=UPI003BAB6862